MIQQIFQTWQNCISGGQPMIDSVRATLIQEVNLSNIMSVVIALVTDIITLTQSSQFHLYPVCLNIKDTL